MDPIKKLKLRFCYIRGESLVLLSFVSTLVLNLALSNLTIIFKLAFVLFCSNVILFVELIYIAAIY